MIICPKCNKELPDGTRFCEACGAQIDAQVFCAACGAANAAGDAFCQGCGAPMNAAAPAADATPAAAAASPLAGIAAKINKKLVAIGAAVVALILIIAIVLPAIFAPKGNFLLYVKDGDMYWSKAGSKKSTEMDGKLFDGALLSKNGKYLYYSASNGSFYWRLANKPKTDAYKIASDVDEWYVSDNGKLFTYISDGDLCQAKLAKESKEVELDGDVDGIKGITADGKTIVYTKDTDDESENYNLYYAKGKKAEKIESGISSSKVSPNCKYIYYIKGEDNELYKQTVGKDDAKEIADGVSYIEAVYDSGDAYYTKSNKSDDEDDDSGMKYGDFVTNFTPESEYYNPLDSEIYSSSSILCYTDGKKETVVNENAGDYILTFDEKPIVTFTAIDYDSVEKVDGSKVDEDDIRDKVKEAISKANTLYTAQKAKAKAVEGVEAVSNISFDKKGKTVYFLSDVETKSFGSSDDDSDYDSYSESAEIGTLQKVSVGSAKPKKIADDVYDFGLYGKKLGYKADYNGNTYDFYLEGKKIDSDINSMSYDRASKVFVFECDKELKISKNGGKVKLVTDDENYGYEVMPGGDLYYLTDRGNKGSDLFMFKGSKSVKIDDDVQALVEVVTWDEYQDYR